MNKITTHKRVNITLPRETISIIDRVTKKGNRSHFLNEAVRFYIKENGRTNLKKLLKEGAKKRTERDLELAKDWFPLEL